ncbi:LOW QUALITY PROTEIN: zona pellucida-binding protein 1 [Podargus strigoides]
MAFLFNSVGIRKNADMGFFPVKFYVKLNHNSPPILCLTDHLNLELIDPIFQWNGPGGALSSKNSSVQISPTGTLMLRYFNLSGVYTCSIVYKLTAMQPKRHLIIKYLIYVAFLDREKHNKLCQQSACDASDRLNKAKQLIERFFKEQVEVSRKSSELLPEIYYIEGTLQMVQVNCCYPGYGMNARIHPDCPRCCVVCSPGSYNPSNGIHCLRCNSSLIYGETKC